MGKFVGGRPPKSATGKPLGAAADSLVSDRYPAIWDYCTTVQWADGTPRPTATMLLFMEDGVWKICFNDRAAARQCWAGAATVMEALDVLESALAKDTAMWRAKPQGGGKGRG